MKKLSFYFLLILIFNSCSTIKHVPDNELLLAKNTIIVDEKKTSKEKILNFFYNAKTQKYLVSYHYRSTFII